MGTKGDGVAALGDLISGASQMGEERLQQPRRYLLAAAAAASRDREDHQVAPSPGRRQLEESACERSVRIHGGGGGVMMG